MELFVLELYKVENEKDWDVSILCNLWKFCGKVNGESKVWGSSIDSCEKLFIQINIRNIVSTDIFFIISPYGRNLFIVLGNGIVSRTWLIPVSHATSRSNPTPNPL